METTKSSTLGLIRRRRQSVPKRRMGTTKSSTHGLIQRRRRSVLTLWMETTKLCIHGLTQRTGRSAVEVRTEMTKSSIHGLIQSKSKTRRLGEGNVASQRSSHFDEEGLLGHVLCAHCKPSIDRNRCLTSDPLLLIGVYAHVMSKRSGNVWRSPPP